MCVTKLAINCRLKCVTERSAACCLRPDVFVTDVDILDYVSLVFTVKDEKSSFSDATTAPIAQAMKLPNCTFFRTTSSSCSSDNCDMLALSQLTMYKRAPGLPA